MCSSNVITIALRWFLLASTTLHIMTPNIAVAEGVDTFFQREETEAISAQCENLEFVTGPLHASDADGNGFLSQDEFVVFTDLVSGGWLSDMGVADSFRDMPLVLQEANVVLTCLCELYSTQPWGQPGCCDNTATSGIRVDGSGRDEKPDEVQLEYLTYVCGTMSETLGRLNAQVVAPPSSAPSDHPSVSPSIKPTMIPTSRPTPRPSKPPTSAPTGSPTLSPTTLTPTSAPTSKPSSTPTSKPTAKPSPEPTTSPTSAPTAKPSPEPSSTPSLSPITSSPTMAPIEPNSPTRTPTTSPSLSPTDPPSTSPSVAPTLSKAPTVSPTFTSSYEPSVSFPPTISSVPTLFSGELPISVNFVQSLGGNVTAASIMEGTTNQVKTMMETALLKLANLVIEQINSEARRMMLRRRELVVKQAKNATVTDVQEIENLDNFLAWDTVIVVDMIDEADRNGQADAIQQMMLSKIAAGWLNDEDNFDLEEALKPPIDNEKDPSLITEVELNPDLSVGGVVGIALASLALVILVALFAVRRQGKRDNEAATTPREIVKDSDHVADDLDVAPTDDVSEVTENYSYASNAYLLKDQKGSFGGPALGKLPDESEEDSFYDSSIGGDEDGSFVDSKFNQSSKNASYLAAMGAASTLVASTSRRTPRSASSKDNSFFTPDSKTSSAGSRASFGASPTSVGSGAGYKTRSVGGSSGEGLSNEAATGNGDTLSAGAIAAGAYVSSKSGESDGEDYIGEIEPEEEEPLRTSTSQMDELDIAIEAGDWGHVGALAAVLAAEGRRTVKSPRSITSGDGASSRSRGTSTNQSMDQARAAEIDKLVEAGDWQGVVLAAARFEADQTMDGESHSAASKSSMWSDSGRSSASGTQRSFGTTHSSHAAGRSQAEIRAEVEALVRRVVPEEADNIDEMLNQFKGREEELVETLRRMQERAIASRARLAVQKSVKMEARARVRPPSVKTVSSHGSSKELEQAIEEGNWLAVGQAAQKISDQNEGSLTLEEKERLRQKISQSPAMNSQPFSSDNMNLDELIEKGDWSGVIAAAKAASEGSSVSNAGNISKEEQDALAQASMWQAIANQSKQDGGPDSSGAGDAAAWAISRSLNALNAPNENRSRTINDIADEESSDASQYESGSYSRDFRGGMV